MDLEWIIGLSSAGGVALASGVSYVKQRFSGKVDIDEYINTDWRVTNPFESSEATLAAASFSLGSVYAAAVAGVSAVYVGNPTYTKIGTIVSGLGFLFTAFGAGVMGTYHKEVSALKKQFKQLESYARSEDNEGFYALKDKLNDYVAVLEQKYNHNIGAQELLNRKLDELQYGLDPHEAVDTPDGVVTLVPVAGSRQVSPE